MLTSPGRRFLAAVGGIIVLVMAGMLGYMLIEHFDPLDALYMSVITISTVGFGEVHSLDRSGRIFTIVLIIGGVGTSFYLLAVIAELLIEGRLREHLGATAMHRMIHQLQNHVIVCGCGRFGRIVVEELTHNAVPVVVIDPDPLKAAELVRLGVPHITASALDEATLEEAGIRNARTIVAATGSDADNVYITLSAREKSPSIQIYARAESETGLRRLSQAGANQVVSAVQHSAMRVASTILRPSVVDFLELTTPGRGNETDLEQIMIPAGSPLIGRQIEEIEHDNRRLRIVALRREGKIMLIPDAKSVLQAEDYLVAIGERASLKRLAEATSKPVSS